MDETINLKPKFVGFFPKENDYGNHLKNEGITEICSVSECIREGPKDWIDLWKHNDLGFYDSQALALSTIMKVEEQYTIFAYKLFLFCYENGKLKTESKMVSRANKLNITEDLTDYSFVGFDVVNCSDSDFFECSAFSCNFGSQDYKVNEYCLLQDLDYAISALKQISDGNYEPGDQYLLEVYRHLGE
jgi:hypothetical protein